MDRRAFVVAVTTSAVATGCDSGGRRAPSTEGRARSLQRGIAFDGYGGAPAARDFRALAALGVTHVALFPYGYMENHRAPEVFRFTGDTVDPSLTDEGLLGAAGMARLAGLEVVLLPTLEDFRDGHWRGEVRMADEDAWRAWFASYGNFLLHYARLAEQAGAVGLSVGTELKETVHREREWRALIARVRTVFSGWLTYAANWDEYERVPWWDVVDQIGIQAYFELGDPGAGGHASRTARLVEAWAPTRERLEALSRRVGRPVAFTEVGYKSHAGATARPWEWRIRGSPDPDLQAAAYEAAFRTFWGRPWFAGFYWWKWHAASVAVPDAARNFTPQGKPAAQVLRRYYGVD